MSNFESAYRSNCSVDAALRYDMNPIPGLSSVTQLRPTAGPADGSEKIKQAQITRDVVWPVAIQVYSHVIRGRKLLRSPLSEESLHHSDH